MLSLDQDALATIQPELQPGEGVLWAGRPSIRPIFHRNEDADLLPFSLMWGGFAFLWEIGMVWSIFSHPTEIVTYVGAGLGLFLAMKGQDMIWGRFLRAARKKKRTYYAVTDKRVIVVQTGVTRQVATAPINALQTFVKQKRAGSCGTIRFVPPPVVIARTWSEMMSDRFEAWDALSIKRGPVFVDIENVDSVYQLISVVRDRATEAEVARILRTRESG